MTARLYLLFASLIVLSAPAPAYQESDKNERVPPQVDKPVQDHIERLRPTLQQQLLEAIDMSEDELRKLLKDEDAAARFAAAYVVGERRLPWHKDLIERLTDSTEEVRQAARRSLVILGFLSLNADLIGRLEGMEAQPPAKPAKKVQRAADFGPPLRANRERQVKAARDWTVWWKDRKPFVAAAASEEKATRLADELVQAEPARLKELLTRYQDPREAQGSEYTEALAVAAARQSGAGRKRLREALVERLWHMKEGVLLDYLADKDAEVRRGAALALAMADTRSAVPRVIDLIKDPEPSVVQGARAALRAFTGQDFLPNVNANEDDRALAAERWRAWWRKNK